MNADELRNFDRKIFPACAFQDTSETYSTSQILPFNFCRDASSHLKVSAHSEERSL